MKLNKLKSLTFAGCICLLISSVFYAQSSQDGSEAQRQEQQRTLDSANAKSSPLPPATTTEDRLERDAFYKNREIQRDKLIAELNKKYQIPAQYLAKYKEVLRTQKFVSARIFPDADCYRSSAVSVEELERCKDRPQIIGGGSLYSFRFKNIPLFHTSFTEVNGLFKYADIRLLGDELIVGTNGIQNTIVEVGNIELEKINKKSEAVKFLDKQEIATNRAEFNRQKELITKGIENKGLTYTNKVKVKMDTSYILRSIAYIDGNNQVWWNPDQTVAFRIVGIEPDGSIIILWKVLNEKRKKPFYLGN